MNSTTPKQSLSDKAYALIRRDIVTCGLAPGESLTEQQFRDRYKLTIASTRAALGRLAQEQLVSAEPRRGYVIAPLTLRDVIEVFDARMVLEAAAVTLAIEKLTAESLADIEEAANFARNQGKRGPDFLTANRAFHMAIAHASGNSRIVKMIDRLLDEAERVLHLGLVQFDASDQYKDEHEEVLEHIRARNAAGAAELTRKQIEGGKQMVLAAVRSSPQIMNLDLTRLAFTSNDLLVNPPNRSGQRNATVTKRRRQHE